MAKFIEIFLFVCFCRYQLTLSTRRAGLVTVKLFFSPCEF